MMIEITKRDARLLIAILIVAVIVLIFGGDIVRNPVGFNAAINGVPSEILIGTPDEDMGIISGNDSTPDEQMKKMEE